MSKDAIQRGVLTPYKYYPIPVELTAVEADEYSDSLRNPRMLVVHDDEAVDNPILTALLSKLSPPNCIGRE